MLMCFIVLYEDTNIGNSWLMDNENFDGVDLVDGAKYYVLTRTQ